MVEGSLSPHRRPSPPPCLQGQPPSLPPILSQGPELQLSGAQARCHSGRQPLQLHPLGFQAPISQHVLSVKPSHASQPLIEEEEAFLPSAELRGGVFVSQLGLDMWHKAGPESSGGQRGHPPPPTSYSRQDTRLLKISRMANSLLSGKLAESGQVRLGYFL